MSNMYIYIINYMHMWDRLHSQVTKRVKCEIVTEEIKSSFLMGSQIKNQTEKYKETFGIRDSDDVPAVSSASCPIGRPSQNHRTTKKPAKYTRGNNPEGAC